MKIFTAWLALSLIALASAEDDGKLTIEIPSAVQATIAREKGDAGKVREYRKINEPDGTTYILVLDMDGRAFVLYLDAGGRVMRKHLDEEGGGRKVRKLDALPVNVRQTLQREAGAGVIEEVELIEERTKYVTEVKLGKRKYRIEVDAGGVLLNKEYIGDEE